jgi:Tfp pilus assembly protein PilO
MALKDYKFTNLPPTTQLMVFVTVILILGGVFYSLYMRGVLDQRSALEVEVADLQKSVAQTTAVAMQLQRFKTELAQTEQKLAVLRSILPAQKETPMVLRSVQQMADSSNLKIIKFNPQPVAPRSFYSDWPIVIEVEGNYDSLGLFFEKVGAFARLINLDNIKISGIEGSIDPSHTLSATCTAMTFVFREEQAGKTSK